MTIMPEPKLIQLFAETYRRYQAIYPAVSTAMNKR
jgi:hypothetical protein